MTTAFQEYREGMAASLAVKDNNAFWPRGIPALSYPSAHHVLERFRDLPATATMRAGLNPTSVLCLMLYLTHGVRRAGWPSRDRLPVADMLLHHVIESRSGTLRPAGPILLRRWRELPGADHILAGNRNTESGYVSECFRLAGQAFALGETAFFFAHRLLTERHGPYPVADGLFVSCRHIRHLTAAETVWPEAHIPPIPDAEIAIWTFFDADAADGFTFDMWGNPVFALDPARDCLGAAVYLSSGESGCSLLRTAQLTDLRARFADQARHILGLVKEATEARLAEAMESIMLAVADLELDVGTRAAVRDQRLRPPFGFRVDGPVNWLADYYDWRCAWPRAAEPKLE
jgi:hypothetical protein